MACRHVTVAPHTTGQTVASSQDMSSDSSNSSESSDDSAHSDHNSTSLILMFQDRAPVDVQHKNILENLLPQVSDAMKQLSSYAQPRAFLKLLESTYVPVEDGDEIFTRFLNTHQNWGERASEYLQRLEVLLGTTLKRNGVSQSAANHQPPKQMWLLGPQTCSAVGAETLNFAELLLQLWTEEDWRATKLEQIHCHFGTSKSKAIVNEDSEPHMSP